MLEPTDQDIAEAMRLAGFTAPDTVEIAWMRDEHKHHNSWPFAFAHAATIAQLRIVEERLNGYRAATSWIAADSWDGCSECIAQLRAARTADVDWDWAGDPNRIAAELAKIRPFIRHAQIKEAGNG